MSRFKDGREWRIGGAAEVAWIEAGTDCGLAITAAIPPIFEAYCTLTLPNEISLQRRHDRRVVALLEQHSQGQPWWLGYLETGPWAEVVFHDAPRVKLYAAWDYVLVQAGPEQALNWRPSEDVPVLWKGALPELMFPADHAWLFSTLWDDDWSSIGGSEELTSSFVHDPELGKRTRIVTPGEDATPPGHSVY